MGSQEHLYQYSYVSTPKSKADACVNCDLPFDESAIAPELRKGNCSVDTPDSRRGKRDISINEGARKILSIPAQNSEQEIIEATMTSAGTLCFTTGRFVFTI